MNVFGKLNHRSSCRTRLLRSLAVPLVATSLMALPATSFAEIYLSVNIAPPPLPLYDQPPIPGDGYFWTPGYWAYGDDGYFWVPGTWVMVPYEGALWTPGYWGWDDNDDDYTFQSGYWGDHIGFYGGVDYGYGYGGEGYEGGYWNNGAFFYNLTVNNINTTYVTNVYNQTVINNTTINNVSYNGGPGGLVARPTALDQVAQHEQHAPPIAAQQRQVVVASHDRALLASVNHGAPPIAATPKPGIFSGRGVVSARSPSLGGRIAANPRDGVRNNPNSLRSASFARRTQDMPRSTQPLRPGSLANRGNTLQTNPGALRSASFAPSAHNMRQSTQPLRGVSSVNYRDTAQSNSARFAQRNSDTGQSMQPRRADVSASRGEPMRANSARYTPRSYDAMQSMQPNRGRPMERAGRPVDAYQPVRNAGPAYAPRPQARPQPPAMVRQPPAKPQKPEDKNRSDVRNPVR